MAMLQPVFLPIEVVTMTLILGWEETKVANQIFGVWNCKQPVRLIFEEDLLLNPVMWGLKVKPPHGLDGPGWDQYLNSSQNAIHWFLASSTSLLPDDFVDELFGNILDLRKCNHRLLEVLNVHDKAFNNNEWCSLRRDETGMLLFIL